MPRSEFYSAVQKAIIDKIPDNASSSQVMATLQNTVGVKNQEIHDLNIPSYLAESNGVINKADLLAHVEASKVDLKEVEYGGYARADPFLAKVNEWHDRMEAEYGPRYMSRLSKTDLAEGDRLQTELDNARSTYKEPQYPSQVAPGPSGNYREFVLHAPDVEKNKAVERDAEAAYNQVYGDAIQRGTAAPFARQSKVVRARYLVDARRAHVYQDTHWPGVENPIVHIRTTDRKGENGERVLHAEEIQSTGHQTGAKAGYRDPSVRSYAAI
jgi:hypothetical protein